jgi:ABC-type polysaccharide/polyol phosphate export permease
MVKSIERFRPTLRLALLWARYNIQSRYTEAKLGWLWIVLRPLGVTVIYSTIFSHLLNRPPQGGVPFFLFFLCGLTIWELFANTLSQATGSTASKITLMAQINFPRESIVLVDFTERFIDFLVNFFILVAISISLGHYPSGAYLYLPVVLLPFMAISLGGAFLIAPMSVFIRDISEITSLVLRFFFFFSGAIFSLDMMSPQIQRYLIFNPLLILIDSYRGIILYGRAPSPVQMGIILVLGLVFFALGYRFYKSQEGKFVDYL